MAKTPREGSLEAPTRHPLEWRSEEFYNQDNLFKELERVYDICHGCRRCVSLCHAFPTLFDLVDESETMEVDGVAKADYWKVVDHCYLCDLCFLTKCPYVPPHEWNVDFPHLMLRAKAVKFKQQGAGFRDKTLSNTDTMGKLAGIPVVVDMVNAMNQNKAFRGVLSSTFGVHADAKLPRYHSNTLRKKLSNKQASAENAVATANTTGKVVLFSTCYANYNAPGLGEDLVAVLEHNGIAVKLMSQEQCCGMPKLELGDLESVARAKEANAPQLLKWVAEGWDIVAPIPSCVLMFKQELPLMFPQDQDLLTIRQAIFDPFEYLMLRHSEGKLNLEFKNSLGKVAYHAACHQRVQNIGPKTRDLLSLVPDTEVTTVERCSGHDGTYAVKNEFHEISRKICKPVVNRVLQAQADHFGSDCPMAGDHIENVMGQEGKVAEHPISLLRQAYGI